MSASRAERTRLVADVGGTNARLALIFDDEGLPSNERVLSCADYPSLVEAIEHYLREVAELKGRPRPFEGAVAIANPVTGDWVKMTNHVWAFSIEETRRALGLERLLVLNDFTALAISLPLIPGAELRKIGGGDPIADSPLALLGAGTGLGVSGLIPSPSGWIPLQGEGGHATFSPANAREADILRIQWREHGHVSTERLISGIGMDNLHRAIGELEGQAPVPLTPAEITDRALNGRDPLCLEVLDTFCAMLGTAAANLALTLGARGGVYIGGGIVPRLGDYFAASPFRRRFEEKGRFSSYLAAIPTYVILAKTPALLGAAQALRRPSDDRSNARAD
jgi:glucokinase